MTYDEAIQYLYGLQRFGIKLGLSNMMRLLEALEHPEQRFPSVLVGGTNGKGSTAAFLASILQAAGFRVGLYTSPHLLSFTERFLINGLPIAREEVAALTEEVRSVIEQRFPPSPRPLTPDPPFPHPTYFEVSTAIAFLAFARKGVDYAVVEVGLGGRFDATNILTPEVSIITNVSLEHQEYLGRTLQEIAIEKAGIVKEGKRVVTAAEVPGVCSVLEKVCRERGASLLRVQDRFSFQVRRSDFEGQAFDLVGEAGSYRGLETKLLGRHQLVNAATALAAVELLPIATPSREAVARGLRQAWWPGRLQVVGRRPLLLLDGAHNPAGASALAAFVQEHLAPRRLVLVFGVLKDKDWEGMLSQVGPLASVVILTKPESERAADPRALTAADRYCPKLELQPSVKEAIGLAREVASPGDAILVTGSLFTVAAALRALGYSDLFPPNEGGVVV